MSQGSNRRRPREDRWGIVNEVGKKKKKVGAPMSTWLGREQGGQENRRPTGGEF